MMRPAIPDTMAPRTAPAQMVMSAVRRWRHVVCQARRRARWKITPATIRTTARPPSSSVLTSSSLSSDVMADLPPSHLGQRLARRLAEQKRVASSATYPLASSVAYPLMKRSTAAMAAAPIPSTVRTPTALASRPFVYRCMMARLLAINRISTNKGTATTPLMMAE
jgi:hypothetical protein